MAYATYITEALVCGTFNRNTADRSYLLFTREAGMIYADARSVREERSKQRYALQDFSLVRVSLVKGKRTWRIGSIESNDNFYHQAESKQARGSVVSVFRLLRRFLKGEEASDELFDFVVDGLKVLKTGDSNQFVAEVVQLRIMAYLGYVDDRQIPDQVRKTNPGELLKYDNKEISVVVDKLYVQAVESSHL
jgi:DNA repair protein RecO